MSRIARLPLLVLAIAGAHVPATALADQCAWNDATTAARARDLVRQHPRVLAYCEPCDTPRGAPYTVTDATLREPAAGYTELVLDGQAVDLAYVFVETAPGRYANLAKLAGCEAHGVSPAITVAPTTIAPAPPAPPAPAAAPAPPAPAPCPAATPAPVASPPASAAPPPVFISAVLTRSIDGFVVGLAWLGGTLAGIAGMLGMMLARRRHAMRPRALELPPR